MEGTKGYEGLEYIFLLIGERGREKGIGPPHSPVTFFLPVSMGTYTECGS